MKTISSILAVAEALKNSNRSLTKNIQVNIMITPTFTHKAQETISILNNQKIPYVLRRVRPHKKTSASDHFSEKNCPDQKYFSPNEITYLKETLFSTSINTREYWQMPSGEIQELECNANDTLTRKINHFFNWICWAGIERLHIYPDGDIYRSTCKVGGKLGNIYDTFSLPNVPVICSKQECTCAWALNLSKIKSEEFRYLLKLI